jgi:D-2-hydroxyglutarate dehydrogenase
MVDCRGQYYYRFGSIHANIIGLEVVLPNGTILDLMSTNRKDNTGYDLKHLFVGAEGTLGVITKVALNCPRLPSARNVAFLACNSFESVCQTLSLAKEKLGEVLAAFEFMDKQVLDQVASEKTIPLTDGKKNHNFCILVETLGSDREHDMEKLESFLEQATDAGHVVDGILAQDTRQVSVSM